MAGQRVHSEAEYRELLCEYQSLQRKFDSKVEALLAVSQELADCQIERDKFKTQAIDYYERTRALKSALLAQKKERNRKETAADEQHQNILELLNRINEENRLLQIELERLKSELDEAKGDNKVLRQQLARHKVRSLSTWTLQQDEEEPDGVAGPTPVVRSASKDDQVTCQSTVIGEFERLKGEHSQLERDLKSMLCEKEELVIERDAFKNKAERLNRELNYILNGDDRRVVADVDQLVAENRFLKEQLQHAREENGLRKAELSKYKSCLEKRKPILKSAFYGKLPGSDGDNQSVSSAQSIRSAATGGAATAAAMLQEGLYPLITPKQVKQLLQQQDIEPAVDYRSLASGLNDALNDRNLALSHQRKANKILGNRVTELEARLHALELNSARSPLKQSSTVDTLHPPATAPADRRSSMDAWTMTDEDTAMSTSIDRLRMGVDLIEGSTIERLEVCQKMARNDKERPTRRRLYSLQSDFLVLTAMDSNASALFKSNEY